MGIGSLEAGLMCVSAVEPIRLNAAGMRLFSEHCCYSYLIRPLFLQASSSNG